MTAGPGGCSGIKTDGFVSGSIMEYSRTRHRKLTSVFRALRFLLLCKSGQNIYKGLWQDIYLCRRPFIYGFKIPVSFFCKFYDDICL